MSWFLIISEYIHQVIFYKKYIRISKQKKNIFTLQEIKLLLELWEKIKNRRKILKMSQAELS